MKKAFSLMELMVVIIILGMLAAFVLPNLTGKSEDAKKKIACIQMKSIGQALKMYKIDHSKYPTTDEKLDILVKQNYFEDNIMPKDPWNNYYIYVSTEEENGFDLISLGADLKEGGNNDIYYSKCSKK